MTAVHEVNAFATPPFAGNPAGVCLPDGPASDDWRQDVARLMGFSETAFLSARPDGDGFDLRWFTPVREVELCGHATLASAHALWSNGKLPRGREAVFHTMSGRLSARPVPGPGGWIEMDFPAAPPHRADAPPRLAAGLGAKPVWVGRCSLHYYIAELESDEAVRSLDPDFKTLAELDGMCVIATAKSSDRDFDFISRCFCPAVGIDEDPVTGSAHCALAPFWGARLGKAKMIGHQASGRGGVVRVTLGPSRVMLGGQAVTVRTHNVPAPR